MVCCLFAVLSRGPVAGPHAQICTPVARVPRAWDARPNTQHGVCMVKNGNYKRGTATRPITGPGAAQGVYFCQCLTCHGRIFDHGQRYFESGHSLSQLRGLRQVFGTSKRLVIILARLVVPAAWVLALFPQIFALTDRSGHCILELAGQAAQ